MPVYQFEFAGEYADIVVDSTASSPEEAVAQMRAFADRTVDAEDPITLQDSDQGIYARVWLKIQPDTISERDIIDSWEEGE